VVSSCHGLALDFLYLHGELLGLGITGSLERDWSIHGNGDGHGSVCCSRFVTGDYIEKAFYTFISYLPYVTVQYLYVFKHRPKVFPCRTDDIFPFLIVNLDGKLYFIERTGSPLPTQK